jgi:hypothetical protein
MDSRPTQEPVITVAMPMYRAKHIGWLALEGLARQLVAHPWELLIVEEVAALPMGCDAIMRYEQALADAGCVSIKYAGIMQWASVADKVRRMARQAAPTSEVLVKQDADDFPDAFRLARSLDSIRQGADWFYDQHGLFYDRATGKLARYEHPAGVRSGLNPAVRTSLLRNLATRSKRRGLHSWMHTQATLAKGSPLVEHMRTGDHWRHGVFTCGWNTLSTQRADQVAKHKDHYHPTDASLQVALPEHILARLLAA